MSESTNDNTKRCWVCKKALIDEKRPICWRCILTGKKKTITAGKWVGGLGAAAFAAFAAFGNAQNSSENDIDTYNNTDDEED